MPAVQPLKLQERIHIDGGFLGEVVAQLGPLRGGELIHEALGSMAADLADVTRGLAAPKPDLGAVVAMADRLSRVAWEVGLTTLSGVALDVAQCAERGEMTALHAVAARLQRVGTSSLNEALTETRYF